MPAQKEAPETTTPVLPDEVLVLLNHIENVVDEESWDKIDTKLWNAVTALAPRAHHCIAESSVERFITENDLLENMLQLIVIQPRYTTSKFAAVFGSIQTMFAEMVDALTSGDGDYSRVDSLFTGTPWYPYGEGDTVTEAIEKAIDRINTIEPKYKREALALVHNSHSLWDRHGCTDIVPLVLTGEAW
jgi:hypothetical protein